MAPHAPALVVSATPADPLPLASMGLRGLWALVGNSTAMVVIAVAMLLTMFAAWSMHREGMSTLQGINKQNMELMGRVIDRNSAALDALSKEIHALRTGGFGPDE